MTEPIQSNPFEEKLRVAMRAPQPQPEFLESLRARLLQQPPSAAPARRPGVVSLRVRWAVFALIFLILAGALMIIGPQRVSAAFRRLFGYVPGVGIVEQSAPIRVLAQPVSLTREGVTVSVNSAVLTADQTRLDFGVSGVPLSAYPRDEAVSGCLDHEYLRLPDGTKLMIDAPIPPQVNEATFVLPCIFNTLPGTTPTDWELTLRFIPAPPDLTIMPVIELTPAIQASPSPSASVSTAEETAQPPIEQTSVVVIEKMIETEDGYILIGAFRPQAPEGSWAQVTGVPQIRDVNGKQVPYTHPQDIELPYDEDMGKNGGFPFAFQIKGAGLSFPLTIEFSGVLISEADLQATAELTLDVGLAPQAGQVWTLNREIQLAGYTLKLVSVTALSDGYAFEFAAGPEINSVSVQIEGHTAVGGGGGGAPGSGVIHTSLSYAQLPTGELKMILSNLTVAGSSQTWRGMWQPSFSKDWPSPTPAMYPLCLNADSIANLQPLPAGLNGRALITELNPDPAIALVNFDGNQKRILAPNNWRGALSPNGQLLAYEGAQGIVILDLASSSLNVLPDVSGRDLHWSPDGKQIAYVSVGEEYGIFVASLGDAQRRQLSNLGYEAIAGWSPDGKLLYYAIPDSGGKGWMLRAVDIATGEGRDLFVLENSSAKAPMPAVSPDGKWIAYRGVDNGSLYLIRIDGADGHIIIERPSPEYAISGIVWGPDGGLLGVSIATPENPQSEIILMQVESYEAYALPGIWGELDGLLIP